MNVRLAFGVAVAAATLAGPAPSEAQSWRAQAAWVAGQVGGGVFGAELRRPLGSAPPLPLPGRPGGGPVEAPSRVWHLSGMIAGGANGAPPADTERSIEPLLYLHGGVLYRTGRSVPGYIGLLAASYLPAGVVGPAAFLEAADVAALQLGALYGDDAWRGHLALSLSIRFLSDVLGG